MISGTKTAKALVDKLNTYCIANDLNMISRSSTDTLDTTQYYIKYHLLDNDESSVGLSAESSDLELPIYQLDVMTPKHMTEWKNREQQDLLKKEYSKALFILNDGQQSVQVQDVGKSSVIFDDTHAISSLSVNLTVIATNT